MTPELLSKIATQGLLGVLLVLSLIVIYTLYNETKSERDARLEDMKEVWKEDVQYRSELKSLIQNIFDILRGQKK